VPVTVTLARALREFAGGADAVTVELGDGAVDGATVGQVLRRLGEQHPAVGRRICDEQGKVRRHVNVFVNGTKALDDAPVAPGDEVVVLPAVSGG